MISTIAHRRLIPALLCAVLCCGLTRCSYSIPENTVSATGLIYSLISGVPTSFAVTNLHDGVKARTGFLHGTAAGTDLAAVEVSVDGGAYTEAMGTTNWSWQLPTGPTGFKIGKTYALNVRGRDIDGTYTSVISLSIRKGINLDVNGDGYPDLLVGAKGGSTGHAYIFHGGSGGLASKSAANADAILTGEGGTQFGVSFALADINGDGYADASVAGSSAGGNNEGRVYIFHSRGTAGIADTNAVAADAIITGVATNEILGTSMAAGDLNGDGYMDLAVAFHNAGAGAFATFHSTGSAGISTQTSGSAAALITGANSDFRFHVALGDINGDGFADLIASDSTINSFQGEAYVFLSSGGALVSRALGSADAVITGEPSSQIGKGLLLADVNGDGYDDVVAGAPAYSSNTGRVYIFHSSGTGGISSAGAGTADTIITGETGSEIARGMAVGDIDGDGTADLLAGGAYYDVVNNEGRSYIIYSIGSATSGNASTMAGSIFTGGLQNGLVGISTALIDLDADGFDDALLGAGNSTAVADHVYYWRSPGSSIASADLGGGGAADAVLTDSDTSAFFGESITR